MTEQYVMAQTIKGKQCKPCGGTGWVAAPVAEQGVGDDGRLHNCEDARLAVYCAALTGICASVAFHGPLYQQEPSAAAEFARTVVTATSAASRIAPLPPPDRP